MPIKRAYADSRYGQVHYRIAVPSGAAQLPPLLCLHQTPSNSKDWIPVLPALARNRVVIAADTPGYGMSDAPPEPVLIEDYAGVMLALMDDLAAAGILAPGPFDVLGFHTGSLIATELARANPDRVRRAAMFGLAAYPAEQREEKLARLLENFPPPGDNLDHVQKLWAIISQLSDSRLTAEEKHIGMAECLRLGARMPWGYISVYRYDFLAAMTQVAQPVLVMNPEDDLWERTCATSDRFPNGLRYDMPGVKHGVLKLEHDRVIARLDQFFGQ